MCTNADESTTFSRSEDFVAHLHAEHDGTMSEEESAQWSEICTRSVPLAVETCPLCVGEPPPTVVDPASLLEHIADHLHEFSLQSLPWMDVPDRSSQPPLPRDKRSHIQAWISSEEESTASSSEQDRTAGPTGTQVPLTDGNLATHTTALLVKWDPAPDALQEAKDGDDLMHYFAESSGASAQAQLRLDTAFSDYQDTLSSGDIRGDSEVRGDSDDHSTSPAADEDPVSQGRMRQDDDFSSSNDEVASRAAIDKLNKLEKDASQVVVSRFCM